MIHWVKIRILAYIRCYGNTGEEVTNPPWGDQLSPSRLTLCTGSISALFEMHTFAWLARAALLMVCLCRSDAGLEMSHVVLVMAHAHWPN